MSDRVLHGAAASPGIAVGAVRLLDPFVSEPSPVEIPVQRRGSETTRALDALSTAAGDLAAMAASLRREGRSADSEIVETGVLMAEDPQLKAAVTAAIVDHGRSAEAALIEAAEAQAELVASVDDQSLAARADDVRSVGRRAARIAKAAGREGADPEPAGQDRVLVAEDLGPADVAELTDSVRAVVLAAGAVTAHAAIVARSLALPMVVAAGEEVLRLEHGSPLIVDGDQGQVVVSPSRARIEAAKRSMGERAQARHRAIAASALPSTTLDGHRVAVLANVASAAEVRDALDVGAEGAGLIRTELPFLNASRWPTEDEHLASLQPLLAQLEGRTATVRVLDFGGDKTPPYLAGTVKRGLGLVLEAPEALSAQFRAILRAGRACELRVLLPMVTGSDELHTARALLHEAVAAIPGGACPRLGAMIETPQAAAAAAKLALGADFLSIGTNDLAHTTLGTDRFAAPEATAHHPRVLALVQRSVEGAHNADMPIEVCGEAASDPLTLPLLVGLGVDELSVGAARVGLVREQIRALRYGEATDLARRALELTEADEVATLMAPLARSLALLERGNAHDQGLEGRVGVLALGSQP